MRPKLAQVLNTVAHEIRTPLAVSQGYLKLYIDGRLPTPDDQQRALQQTRDALGVIATLCSDIGKVSALASAPEPALVDRVAARELVAQLETDFPAGHVEWTRAATVDGAIATNNSRDLINAVAVVVKSAFDDVRDRPRAVHLEGDRHTLTLLAGSKDAVPALQSGAAGNTRELDIERGGKGMNLIWASLVLDQHHIGVWNHRDHKASVGLRFTLVQP